ncbi:hypothetical protein F5984_09580 [Rudanella paleaurantiibacter]|uniref:histidine kinase n=1 Tax=Rudanella paleaurantiibacter TaxID=2614655 RepID=A0A7J5TZZ0_9BACT|nr:HAMP domain-containing sensor histidine kinase [Rudanella paleaurantiibacter]KAB7731058.1 hypothetical protein F5984_09580 [Rudanella paleaurantiibacter]
MSAPLAGSPSLADLGAYLLTHKDTILHNWWDACLRDTNLRAGLMLSPDEQWGRIPDLLATLAQRMEAQAALNLPNQLISELLSQTQAEPDGLAEEHGLHRWQKGYTLQELMGEIAHLHQCITHQEKDFWANYPLTEPALLLEAGQITARLIHELISGSVGQYHTLQKQMAADRASKLQQSLNGLNDLIRQRSNLLRMASHDLKGSFGIMSGAAYLLDQPDNSEQVRTQMLQMLQRNLSKVTGLLTQLMDLARLEAGHEVLYLEEFDAAQLLHRVAESVQTYAGERNLYLSLLGPEKLPVRSDSVKVQRIAQNLLLNALKYTATGGVTLSWGIENDAWWHFTVTDTGPGLGQALNTPHKPGRGEGLGLHIVKLLCSLLKGKMAVDSQAGVGTSFRIMLPTQYSPTDDINREVKS